MKKQTLTQIGNGELIITSNGENADTYYIALNPQTGKFYYRSAQGINTAFQREYKSLEAAIKDVKNSIENE
jgi:outer membrane protein assembly factor BamB